MKLASHIKICEICVICGHKFLQQNQPTNLDSGSQFTTL
jgi:hypothetical protein